MENKERGQREAHCQKQIESIKGEVTKLINLLKQVLSFKKGKGMFAQHLVETTSVHVLHTRKNN